MGSSDVFTEPPFRFIGYAFAVWESIKAVSKIKPEKTLYVAGMVFILLHALSKALDKNGSTQMFFEFVDTLIFEAIASVLVPVLVAKSVFDTMTHILRQINIHQQITKYGPVLVSLLAILIISHPVDAFTHKLLDKTIRTLYGGGWF